MILGFPASAPIFCCLIKAVEGDDLSGLPLGVISKPVVLLVLLPVPAAVPLLSVDGERIELGP